MDGVLIDNSRAYAAAWQVFLAEQREHLAQPHYSASHTFGRRNEELFPDVFGRAMEREEIATLADRLESIYRDTYLPVLKEIRGLSAFLQRARALGHRLALATSAPRRNVGLVLGKLGLEGTFETILCEDDVRRGKPDPEIYLSAATRLGAPASACVVFEDSFPGLAAARASGARVVALETSYRRAALEETQPDLIIADYTATELPRLLGWGAAVPA